MTTATTSARNGCGRTKMKEVKNKEGMGIQLGRQLAMGRKCGYCGFQSCSLAAQNKLFKIIAMIKRKFKTNLERVIKMW